MYIGRAFRVIFLKYTSKCPFLSFAIHSPFHFFHTTVTLYNWFLGLIIFIRCVIISITDLFPDSFPQINLCNCIMDGNLRNMTIISGHHVFTTLHWKRWFPIHKNSVRPLPIPFNKEVWEFLYNQHIYFFPELEFT